jgi:hypothetical protein
MDARDLFLAQHGAVHSAAVGGNTTSGAERAFGGLTDEQMRVRPREDLNSLAWLLWHIARAEDVMVNAVLAGRGQVLDDEGWAPRLRVDRRDFGIGMTGAEVTELTRRIDLAAARDYRDAVGRRTQELVRAMKDADWQGEIQAPALERAAEQGAFGARREIMVKNFTGRPRMLVLAGIALTHPALHIGEAITVRTAGGFGPGI